MPNYIEEKVEEFMKTDCQCKFIITTPEHSKEDCQHYTYSLEKYFLKDSLTSLLLKCKEAVGEEKLIPKSAAGSREEVHSDGWNSCRSTTLQNLDALK
jgi:hypothetical protein